MLLTQLRVFVLVVPLFTTIVTSFSLRVGLSTRFNTKLSVHDAAELWQQLVHRKEIEVGTLARQLDANGNDALSLRLGNMAITHP